MVSLAKIIGIFINVCIACAASKYDKAINHFSDKGSLLQVEYALKATTLGSPVIAAKACNGDLVIGFQSLDVTRSLLDRRSVNKLAKVDDNTWVAFSGLSGDGDALIKEARIFSISYASTFGVGPSVGAVARYIASIQHKITLSGGTLESQHCYFFLKLFKCY